MMQNPLDGWNMTCEYKGTNHGANVNLTLSRTESPGMYHALGGKIRVTKAAGRTWSARNGSTAWVRWTAYIPALLGLAPELREVATGPTLAAARRNLSRWLADSEAGTVGPRSRYGWAGDARPAPSTTVAAIAAK